MSSGGENEPCLYLVCRNQADYLSDTMKNQFMKFCADVSFHESYRSQAWHYYELIISHVKIDSLSKNHLLNFSACLYLFASNKSYRSDNSDVKSLSKIKLRLSTCSLLEINGSSMLDFINLTKRLYDETENVTGSTGYPVLLTLQRNYCITSYMYHIFSRWSKLVYKTGHEENYDSWLLFLLGKLMYFPDATNIQSLKAFLLCCISNVASKSKNDVLKSPLDLVKENALESEGAIVDHLIKITQFPFSVLSRVRSSIWTKFHQDLIKAKSTAHEGFSILDERYNSVYATKIGFDERWFVTKYNTIGLKKNDSNEVYLSQSHHAEDELSTLLEDQNNGILPQSLEVLLSDYPKCCPVSLQTNLSEMVIKVENALITSSVNSNTVELIDTSKSLYWKKMTSMLTYEKHKQPNSDLSGLLDAGDFQRCLFAMAIQSNLSSDETYKSNKELAFPWITDVLNLQVYDFLRIIEGFILHAPYVDNTSVLKSLKTIEGDILLYLTWKKDSKVFGFLTNMENSSDINMFYSKNRTKALLAGDDMTCSYSLKYFMRKVRRMTLNRLQRVCEKLNINNEEMLDVWQCLDTVLMKHTNLLQDRHLDQLLMCSIYAVSKVLGKDVQFKQIVSTYKELTLGTDKIFHDVHLHGNQRGSIIVFYNVIFMPTMKDVVLKVAIHKRIAADSPDSENATPTRSKLTPLNTPKIPLMDKSNQVVPSSNSPSTASPQLPCNKRRRIHDNFTYTKMK